nr:succinylglutamate desuccinylase [Cytophagales bacterium]
MSGIFPKIEIDSGKLGPKGLIISGVHGDEYEPVVAILELQSSLRKVLTKGALTLIPVVNQNAFFRKSRTGEDDKDLARSCPGIANGTLTDKVAYQISNLIIESDFLIDMHTGGTFFDIYPLAGYMLHPDADILTTQRAMAKAFNLPITWGTNPELEGRTLSVARDANKPAIYTEYGGGRYNPHAISELVDGCLNILSYFGMLSEEGHKPSMVKYEVEDYRKSSGHLQIMYPSPKDGIFLTKATLGNPIQKGELIGEVYDLNGENNNKIVAEEDGLVFLLRTIPSVKAGEALAGILPISQPGRVHIK